MTAVYRVDDFTVAAQPRPACSLHASAGHSDFGTKTRVPATGWSASEASIGGAAGTAGIGVRPPMGGCVVFERAVFVVEHKTCGTVNAHVPGART